MGTSYPKSAVAAIILCLSVLLNGCTPRDRYISFRGYAQGGEYSVTLNLNGAEGRIKLSPAKLKADVDSILTDIDNTLSGYNKGSMLSRLNTGDSIVPNPMFAQMYRTGYEIWKETGGKVDVAAGGLFDIWGFGFSNDSLPSDGTVKEVLGHVGMKRLRPDIPYTDSDGCSESAVSSTDLLADVEDMKFPPTLNFNAIAQGFSCDIVAGYLYSLGVKDMLVDIGEIFCDGVNPKGEAWKIGVDTPFDGNDTPGAELSGIMRVAQGAHGVVTSGNYRKFYIRDGQKFAHTIDPISGYPVQHNLLSATIQAPTATMADAYATYCMVIGTEASMKFISDKEDIEGYLIYDKDGEMTTWHSPGFDVQ